MTNLTQTTLSVIRMLKYFFFGNATSISYKNLSLICFLFFFISHRKFITRQLILVTEKLKFYLRIDQTYWYSVHTYTQTRTSIWSQTFTICMLLECVYETPVWNFLRGQFYEPACHINVDSKMLGYLFSTLFKE